MNSDHSSSRPDQPSALQSPSQHNGSETAQPSSSAAARHLITLLQRVQKQDRQAFADLYALTSDKLFGVLLRLMPTRALAEEVLQEAYLRIWTKAGNFNPSKAAAITWMVTVARNLALDDLRKRQLPSDPDGKEHDITDENTNLERDLDSNYRLKRLEHCLSGIGGDQASMIRLAYLDGASREELSQRFEQPVNTVKSWLRRGLQQLKLCLGPEQAPDHASEANYGQAHTIINDKP